MELVCVLKKSRAVWAFSFSIESLSPAKSTANRLCTQKYIDIRIIIITFIIITLMFSINYCWNKQNLIIFWLLDENISKFRYHNYMTLRLVNTRFFGYFRLVKLDRFLSQLVTIPHVPEMICVKAFLGIMDQVSSSLSHHQMMFQY